jgi:ribonuclease-3
MKKGLFSYFRRVFFSKRERGESNLRDSLFIRLSYRFRNPSLLERALTHRSSLPKTHHTLESNERLEFLGDAVLGLVVTEELYLRFPNETEGSLTKMKSHIVSRERLAEEAHKLGLGEFLILGQGEEQAGGRRRHSILSDAYEALIGAVYLDGGLEAVRQIVVRSLFLKREIGRARDYLHQKNYKSWLLEHVQAEGGMAPEYRVKTVKGPDHIKEFTIEVLVRNEVMGTGSGLSKKKAEQAAAREALGKLGLM